MQIHQRWRPSTLWKSYIYLWKSTSTSASTYGSLSEDETGMHTYEHAIPRRGLKMKGKFYHMNLLIACPTGMFSIRIFFHLHSLNDQKNRYKSLLHGSSVLLYKRLLHENIFILFPNCQEYLVICRPMTY